MTKILVALLTAAVLAAGPVPAGPAVSTNAGWFCSIFPFPWLCR